MDLIQNTHALSDLCNKLSQADFVTVDTEFHRESTYWPLLCLIQLAGPDESACVDTLSPELDLTPLLTY